MQPVWLCILSCTQFEQTFENAQWRKTNKCNQCDCTMAESVGLMRQLKKDICTNTAEKGFTYAISVTLAAKGHTLKINFKIIVTFLQTNYKWRWFLDWQRICKQMSGLWWADVRILMSRCKKSDEQMSNEQVYHDLWLSSLDLCNYFHFYLLWLSFHFLLSCCPGWTTKLSNFSPSERRTVV